MIIELMCQPVSNGCHDILMMSIDINSISILNIHGDDYRCIFVEIRVSDYEFYVDTLIRLTICEMFNTKFTKYTHTTNKRFYCVIF